MKYYVSGTDGKNRKRRLKVDAASLEEAAERAAQAGVQLEDVRPEDVYDRIGAFFHRRSTCRHCGEVKLLPIGRRCGACRRKIAEARRQEAGVEPTPDEAQPPPPPDPEDGNLVVGGWRVPASSIQAIEPYTDESFVGRLFGASLYGWTVQFFHRGSYTVKFKTIEQAEAYSVYLRRRVPGVQIIRREEQFFWWVSF